MSLLLLFSLFVGCEVGSEGITGSEPNASLVVEVEPAEAVVEVGATIQFEADVLDENGDPVEDAEVTWSSSDPAVVSVGQATGLAEGQEEGTAEITATVEGVDDQGRLDVVSPSGPSSPSSIEEPELPRELIRWSPPEVTGATIQVGPEDDLQTAINNAEPGDEIVVDPDGEWNSTITLPARDDDGWITIRADASLPAYGERIGPDVNLPRINLVDNRGIVASGNTRGWWMTGLEIVATEGSWSEGVTVESGAERIVWDRGRVISPDFGFEIRRGLRANGAQIEVVGSRFEGIHLKGSESQAIALWAGPGPLRIHNNFLEAASIGFISGGSNTDINPADIEFTNNHVYKRPSWFNEDGLAVKNGFETKNVRRILVEGNIIENNWAGGQTGFIILLKSTDPNACPDCGTTDVTFRRNKIINSPKGLNIARATGPGGEAVPQKRILYEDVLFEKWGEDSDFAVGGTKQFIQILGGIDDFTIRRVSGVNTVQSSTAIEYSGGALGSGFEITSVAIGPTSYGVRGDGGDTLDDLYEPSPRVFGDIYAVENSNGKCADSTGDSDFAANYFCVASAGEIPGEVGADESAVNQAIEGVRDPNLPQ